MKYINNPQVGEFYVSNKQNAIIKWSNRWTFFTPTIRKATPEEIAWVTAYVSESDLEYGGLISSLPITHPAEYFASNLSYALRELFSDQVERFIYERDFTEDIRAAINQMYLDEICSGQFRDVLVNVERRNEQYDVEYSFKYSTHTFSLRCTITHEILLDAVANTDLQFMSVNFTNPFALSMELYVLMYRAIISRLQINDPNSPKINQLTERIYRIQNMKSNHDYQFIPID